MSGRNVIPLPSATALPALLASAPVRPFITELDAALMMLADLGDDCGELRVWRMDRPLTAAEVADAIAWFNASPATDVPARSAVLRDYSTQMQAQADSFGCAAAALLTRSPDNLGADVHGGGSAEVRRLLTYAADLLALDGLTGIDAKAEVKQKLDTLAATFQRAASACREWSAVIHAARDARDGDRMAERLLRLTQQESAS